MDKKSIFIVSTMVCAAALATAVLSSNQQQSIFMIGAGVEPYKIDLVQALQGVTISDGVATFEHNNYAFSFLTSGVTISNGSISIADGGYIKNATAFNGLDKISLTGSYDHALLSTGTLSSVAVIKQEDKVAPTDMNVIAEDSTHFKLEAEGGAVSFSKLELAYQCGSAIQTDSSSAWGYSWDFCGLGTQASPILIRSLSDWNKFATYSENNTFNGVFFALTADIDASSSINALKIAFDSDNTNQNSHLFNGHFDGRGHTIKYNVVSSGLRKGLFCRTGSAEIKNLVVEGSIKAPDVIGTIVGENYGNTTISNCISRAEIKSDGTPTSTGGIIGLVASGNSRLTIQDTEFDGKIAPTNITNVGGILGNVNAVNTTTTIRNCVNRAAISSSSRGVGGILGRSTSGSTTTLEGCVNDINANISTSNTECGGIAGKLLGKSTIRNCTNLGKVNVTNSAISSAGGIVGYIEGIEKNSSYSADKNTFVIDGCVNKGNVTGSRFIGGIVGMDEPHTNSDKTKTKAIVEIINCINEGVMTATNTNAGVKLAGIAGGVGNGTAAEHTTIQRCINLGSITSGNTNANDAALVGGIGGSLGDFTKIMESANYGSVYSKGGYVGGISGEMLKAVQIENCINYGQVTVGKARGGGITGDITDGGVVKYCTNFGNVTGNGVQGGGVGGIAGIYFPKIYSNTYNPEFSHNINHGTIYSIGSFAGGLVGKFGGGTVDYAITDSANYGDVSSKNNVHGGLVGADSSSGTTGQKLYIVNSVSYGTSSGASSNFATGKAHLAAITSSVISGSTLTLNVALQPNDWELESGESYCAIVSKGGNETFVNLTQDGALYKYNVNLQSFENIEFAVLNAGKTISDGRNGVKLSTPVLRLGAGSVYAIDGVGTQATGHWIEAENMVELKLDASSWDIESGYFATQCKGGLNNEAWFMMADEDGDGIYTCTVDAGLYDQARFLAINEGEALTKNEATNLANASAKSLFVGIHDYKSLTYTRMGEYNSDIVGCWVAA